MRTALALAAALTLAACGPGDGAGLDPTADDFDACAILPAEVAAAALGLEASAVERNAYAASNRRRSCVYDAVGGSGNVTIDLEAVAASSDAAAAQFEEYAASAGAAADTSARPRLGAARAAALRYEAVDGLGDEAVVERFRDRFASVIVREGNVIVRVRASTAEPEGGADQGLDPSLEVARGVVRAL